MLWVSQLWYIVSSLLWFSSLYKSRGDFLAFYENFERLCTEKGITPTQVAKDNGIRQSVVAMWKNRGSTPRYNTAKKIAEYFGVSVDYLISGNQETFQLHLACGVHIYKNIVPFENVEELLNDFPEDSISIFYQDEYLLIVVEKDAPITTEEVEKIADEYAPNRRKHEAIHESDSKIRIDLALLRMTEEGRSKVADYAEDILPRYRREDAPPEGTPGKDTPRAESPTEGA